MLGILRSIVTRDSEMGMSDVRVLKLQMNLADGRSVIPSPRPSVRSSRSRSARFTTR